MVQKHEDAKIFENHLDPVMLVFIGIEYSQTSTHYQGFSHFPGYVYMVGMGVPLRVM